MTFSENMAIRRAQAVTRMEKAVSLRPILNMASEIMPNDKLTKFTSELLEMEIKQTQERIDLMDNYISAITAEEIAIENGNYIRGQ